MIKKILSITSLTAVAAVLTLMFPHTSQAEERWIRVTSPNGGETLKVGETHTITWEASPNIDKVSIGYSSGPGNLNWIEFTTENDGQHSWNVNVGNTTKTQFQIDITGYETGSGSTSDRSDGYFTVLGNDPAPAATQPDPTPSSRPAASPTPTTTTQPSQPNPSPSPSPQPVSIQPTNNLITFPVWFWFEGSATTDLSKLDDLTNVENFTLDTQSGFEFVFLDSLDFTNPTTTEAFSNLTDSWYVETWFFWIEISWWEEYQLDTPIQVSYEDPQLTTYKPEVIRLDPPATTDAQPNPQVLAAQAEESGDIIASTADSAGSVTFTLDQAGPVVIKPNVNFTQTESELNTIQTELTLDAVSSHNAIPLRVSINGNQVAATQISQVDPETGAFTVKLDSFNEGSNYVELEYKDPVSNQWTTGDTLTVSFTTPTWLQENGPTIALALIICVTLVAAAWIGLKLLVPQAPISKKSKK